MRAIRIARTVRFGRSARASASGLSLTAQVRQVDTAHLAAAARRARAAERTQVLSRYRLPAAGGMLPVGAELLQLSKNRVKIAGVARRDQARLGDTRRY